MGHGCAMCVMPLIDDFQRSELRCTWKVRSSHSARSSCGPTPRTLLQGSSLSGRLPRTHMEAHMALLLRLLGLTAFMVEAGHCGADWTTHMNDSDVTHDACARVQVGRMLMQH